MLLGAKASAKSWRSTPETVLYEAITQYMS